MLSTERQEFESELAILFGGYPTFLTPPRIEAYWRGLQKMQLDTFRRCVNQALGESGHDKLPTVNTIWQISRTLRTYIAPTKPLEEQPADWYLGFANLSLLRFIVAEETPQADEHTLAQLRARMDELQEQCRRAKGRDEVQEWRALMLDEFAKILPQTRQRAGRS